MTVSSFLSKHYTVLTNSQSICKPNPHWCRRKSDSTGSAHLYLGQICRNHKKKTILHAPTIISLSPYNNKHFSFYYDLSHVPSRPWASTREYEAVTLPRDHWFNILNSFFNSPHGQLPWLLLPFLRMLIFSHRSAWNSTRPHTNPTAGVIWCCEYAPFNSTLVGLGKCQQ